MQAAISTPGPWAWHVHANGAIYLASADPDLIVMDCVRKGTQACTPRFANWPGLNEGEARAGRQGVLSLAHGWVDAAGQLAHPDARLIACSPALLAALQQAHAKLSAAMGEGTHPAAMPVLVGEARQIQASAIATAHGAAA